MMLNTLKQRELFVEQMKENLEKEVSLDNVQLFVFGSFLTEDYDINTSDIDIGVYSSDEIKMYDVQYFLDRYLENKGMKHDIVIMHLSDKLWINIPIMTYGKQLTSFEDTKMFAYLVNMIEKYGFNPTSVLMEA